MRGANGKVLALVCVWLASPPALSAATITVDLEGGGDSTGIQAAIDAAVDGDIVLVKPGEYVISETITFGGKAITVRSAAGAQGTTIRMSEDPSDPNRGSVVVFENGESEASVLQGFTLTGGRGRADRGGGVYSQRGSSPTLRDCVIRGNSAILGGGVYSKGNPSATLINCTISGNSAASGGGIYCGEDSSLTLTNSTVTGNSAAGAGGGVYSWENSSPALADSTISGNSAHRGGGVYCRRHSSLTLTNCTVSGNWADWGGGAHCQYNSSPTLTNCLVMGNSATRGGGVSCGRITTLPSSSITGNSANQDGGVSYEENLRLTNCTITGNSASRGGGVYCLAGSSPELVNCIVWDNAGESFRVNRGSAPQVTYSCLQTYNIWPGEGNINSDPLFVAPGSFLFDGFVVVESRGSLVQMPDFILHPGHYSLRDDSPAIDAAMLQGAPRTDIDGTGRPCGGGIDMGAYERGFCAALRTFRRGDTDGSGGLDISDPVYNLRFQFFGDVIPGCLDALDDNDDGEINLTDPILSLSLQFLGRGRLPPPGYEECGADPTEDSLSCDVHTFCEE